MPSIRAALSSFRAQQSAKLDAMLSDGLTLSGTTEQQQEVVRVWRKEARELRTSSLWWVTPDMATLAADTALCGDEMPTWDVDPETQAGLLVWDGGLPIELPGQDRAARHRVDAASWMRAPELPQHPSMRGFRITAWSRAFATGTVPLGPMTMSIGDETDPLVQVGDVWMAPEVALWRILSATMLLAHQPTVATRRPANYSVDGAARDPRTRDLPDVTVIDLRTARDWKIGPDGTADGHGREYTHRWIVRGHMRTYHVGPRGDQRAEKRWIAPFVAGPAGAPLIPKEHVWVWRRR